MKKLLKGITSWSPSRLAQYEECPRKAKYKFIDRLPDPSGPAASRGTHIHSLAEDYVRGQLDSLPYELNQVEKLASTLRKAHAKKKVDVELELAVDKHWRPAEYKSDDAWLRCKIDVIHRLPKKEARVYDWKTGKLHRGKPEYTDQTNLYSLIVVVLGMAKIARSSLVFIDHGEEVTVPESLVSIKTAKEAMASWEERVEPMFADREFAPRPGNSCRWCAFSKAKGGPCAY